MIDIEEIIDKDHVTETREGIFPLEVALCITKIIEQKVIIIKKPHPEQNKYRNRDD